MAFSNIMKALATLPLLGLAAPTIAETSDCPFQGVWKSDTARTLADIGAGKGLSPSETNAFSYDLFGHMIHEWTCTELRAWFDFDPRPDPIAFRITQATPKSVSVTFPDGEEADLRLIFEGECYKIRFASKTFHEYLCPSR